MSTPCRVAKWISTARCARSARCVRALRAKRGRRRRRRSRYSRSRTGSTACRAPSAPSATPCGGSSALIGISGCASRPSSRAKLALSVHRLALRQVDQDRRDVGDSRAPRSTPAMMSALFSRAASRRLPCRRRLRTGCRPMAPDASPRADAVAMDRDEQVGLELARDARSVPGAPGSDRPRGSARRGRGPRRAARRGSPWRSSSVTSFSLAGPSSARSRRDRARHARRRSPPAGGSASP